MAAKILLVSRHQATIEWMRETGKKFDAVASHLALDDVNADDTIIGNFPLHIAAEINRRGARVIHLAIDMPEGKRGQELGVAELAALNPRLMPFRIVDDFPETMSSAKSSGSTTLVSFLGAPQKGDYRKLVHSHGGHRIESTWMPAAYIESMKNSKDPIKRIVVIGTSGSAWDLLARIASVEDDQLELGLFSDMTEDAASDASIRALEAPLARALGIESVSLFVLPYVTNESASTAMVARLADMFGHQERIVLDVTFGLRDVAFTVFAALLALQSLGAIKLQNIIYAAITAQRSDIAEIRTISAIPQLLSWVRAMNILDATGDLSPLANLLTDDPNTKALLERQQLAEKLLRPRHAANRARQLLDSVRRSTSPFARLFSRQISARLAWARPQDSTSKLQASLALHALADHHYVQATALAFEACISRYAEQNLDLPQFALEDALNRRQFQSDLNDDLKANSSRTGPADNKDIILLRDLRNAMMHASEARTEDVSRIFENPDRLAGLVRRVCDRLIAERKSG